MEGVEMRRITVIAAFITALALAGCANVNVTVKTDTATSRQDNIMVIGGSDGPASIYLSNIKDIPFDSAVMASGLSSNTTDYFSPEEAVFVGWKE